MELPFFTRPKLINQILRSTDGKNYIEIGVRLGATFFRVNCENKIGVDPKSRFAHSLAPIVNKLRNEKSEIFLSTSDVFFSRSSKMLSTNKIDVGFIDGLHTFEQSLKDTDNCLRYLSDEGIIILHDCNPISYKLSTKPDKVFSLTNIWSGDVWKTIVYLRSKRADLRIATLNVDRGIGLVKKGKADSTLEFSLNDVKSMTYADLDLNRQKFLNLKELNYLKSFLN